MTKIKPVFRTPESEIEKIIEEKTKAIEEKSVAEIRALRKQLEEKEREAQRQKEEKEREAQRQKEEKARLEQMAKIAEEQARKVAEEQAKKIAEERAKKIAEEQAKIAEEQAKKVAEEQAKKMAEEQAKKVAEEQAKKVAEERAKDITAGQKTAAAEPPREPSSSKIAKMIEEIKKRRSTMASAQPSPAVSMVPTVDRYKTSVPIISPEQAIDDEDMIKCPTCHTGHVHALKSDGLVYKCTGPDCNEEFVMVPKTADYKCAGCGGPIKKPENPKYNLDACPFCGGKKAVKFNWGKLWKAK